MAQDRQGPLAAAGHTPYARMCTYFDVQRHTFPGFASRWHTQRCAGSTSRACGQNCNSSLITDHCRKPKMQRSMDTLQCAVRTLPGFASRWHTQKCAGSTSQARPIAKCATVSHRIAPSGAWKTPCTQQATEHHPWAQVWTFQSCDFAHKLLNILDMFRQARPVAT